MWKRSKNEMEDRTKLRWSAHSGSLSKKIRAGVSTLELRQKVEGSVVSTPGW